MSLEYGEYRAVKGIFITLRLRLWIHDYTYNMQILCKNVYIKCYRFFMIVIHRLSTYFIHRLSTYCVYVLDGNERSELHKNALEMSKANYYRQSENYLISLSSEEICLSLCYMVYYRYIDYMVIIEG